MDATSEPVVVLEGASNNTGPNLQSDIQNSVVPQAENNGSAPVAQAQKVDIEKARLLRNLQKLISHPVLKKRLGAYLAIDFSSLTVEELKELKDEMEDTCMASQSMDLLTTAVHHGISSIETFTAANKSFPLRLEGLSSALKLANPESDVNIQLAVIGATVESGIKLSPLHRLAFTIGGVAMAVHNANKLIESKEVKQALDKPVPDSMLQQLNDLDSSDDE